MNSAAERAARPPRRFVYPPGSTASNWRLLPFVVGGVLVALQLAGILARNDLHLTYSLDDPYIHLALSENLAEGHYGIEPGEHSAPSSSILWPFLLAPFASLSWHHVMPLMINLAALAFSLGLFASILRRCRLHRATGGEAFAAGLLSVLTLTLNFTGLVFTGMEHSLQVALALAVALGMIVVHRGHATPPYLVVAIVAGPLVRYESAALSVAAMLLLLVHGRWRAAGLAATGCLVLVGAFSLFLMNLGLEPLPGPVLENLEVSRGDRGGGMLAHFEVRLKWILTMMPAKILALLAGGLIALALTSRRRDQALLFCGATAPLLHLGFGSFGGFARYEIYVLASTVAFLIYGLRRTLRRLLTRSGAGMSLLSISGLLLTIFSSYAAIAILTPRAAENIYHQHVMMHRFVTKHYRQPVAVNDLGRVSYRNPGPVLDLWGLCSKEVRRARLDEDPAWPATFVAREGIELVMIYESWFDDRIPPTWRRIAWMYLGGRRITPGSADVSFFITHPGSADEILKKLRRFEAKLPDGAGLWFDDLPRLD